MNSPILTVMGTMIILANGAYVFIFKKKNYSLSYDNPIIMFNIFSSTPSKIC
ncbi:LPXTG cell wall anchor domain-containing protein [Candidatus Enterococcus lemimoniae]|uniref:LPXTG cell wall anchor domain-containing protein n=1 Tax=Candidatus Enterococcus lemimoniae TaxID=1834167 RepID=UPI003BAF5A85